MYTNQFNFNPDNHLGELNQQPSQTVQGQSYTVSELYEKFATGQVPPIFRDGHYIDDPSFDDLDLHKANAMDLDERSTAIELLKKRVESNEAILKQAEEIRKAKELEAEAKRSANEAQKPVAAPPSTGAV